MFLYGQIRFHWGPRTKSVFIQHCRISVSHFHNGFHRWNISPAFQLI
ncbi:hypothetical protein X975_13578, partial [Stegodyphus mimosarum]